MNEEESLSNSMRRQIRRESKNLAKKLAEGTETTRQEMVNRFGLDEDASWKEVGSAVEQEFLETLRTIDDANGSDLRVLALDMFEAMRVIGQFVDKHGHDLLRDDMTIAESPAVSQARNQLVIKLQKIEAQRGKVNPVIIDHVEKHFFQIIEPYLNIMNNHNGCEFPSTLEEILAD